MHPNIYKIDHVLSTENLTKEELEEGAYYCEKYGEVYPPKFPTESISRKQHVLIVVLPRYIREGSVY